jgi:hypothetical protein
MATKAHIISSTTKKAKNFIIFINLLMQYLVMTLKNAVFLMAIVAILALFASTHAITANAYLSNYVDNATLGASSFYNTTLNGNNYVIVQLPGKDRYIVLQSGVSGNYSFVTDTFTIQSILTPFLTNKYYPSASDLAALNSSVRASEDYSSANLTTCLVETGLNQYTCTLANTCFSCQSVPVCKKVLNAIGGPASPFGYGIINFESNYTRLNNSYNSFFSLLGSINPGNAGTVISGLSSALSNITAISKVINNNPIFPPPPGTSFSTCPTGGNPLNAPWYCVAIGFCSVIPFNNTALSNANTKLSSLQSKLPSGTGIALISVNSSVISQNYINERLQSENGAAFNSLVANLTPRFNAVVNKSDSLLSKYDNATLSASLHALENQFSIVLSAGVNQDIGIANKTLQGLLANTTRVYNSANSSYNQVYGISSNNTASLLADQLSYQQVPFKLAMLANQQQNINTQLNKGISSNDVNSLVPSLQSIRVESALYVAPLTAGYMIKVLDTPFIVALLGPSSGTVPAKIMKAPLFASVETLIVDILILVVVFVIVYIKLIRKGKLKHKRGQRLWAIVFAVLIALIALDVYSTYTYATNANSFLPFNYFLNSVKASGNVYIALNGSAASNSSIGACVSTISSYLTKASKTVQVIRLTNYSCVSGSNISVLGLSCYDKILSSNKPVILISQSQSSNITYKGLYGTVLYASGNVTVGSYCTLGTLFRNI